MIESGVSSSYDENIEDYNKNTYFSTSMYEGAPYSLFGTYDSNTSAMASCTLSDSAAGDAPYASIGALNSTITNTLALSIASNAPSVMISQPALWRTALGAGSASGLATLDSNGKVPSTQLPSYVDDVVEYSSRSNFPATGETGKIYVATNTNYTYR